MDQREFISFIREPQTLNKSSLPDIEKLASEFPYCQSLKILYLLNLRMINHVLYTEELKSTAARIADRKRLKELIKNLKREAVEIPEVIDEMEEAKPLAISDPIVPVIEQDEEERLRALKQILEDRLEEIAGEKKTGTPEVELEEKPVVTDSSKEDLIDRFIREQPSISRSKADFFDPVKMAKSSLEEKDDIVSETLAQIHAQQGNTDKAIEIYRKLSLKYPEKSSYFAAQIKKFSTEN
jgi:tetratricopeptide (TPR) repeat protein